MAQLLPNVLPMPGDKLLLVIPNYWAKGDTINECIDNLESSVKSDWVIFSVHPKTFVNEMGGLSWFEKSDDHPDGHEPVKLIEAETAFYDVDSLDAARHFRRWGPDEKAPEPPKGNSVDFRRGWEGFFLGLAFTQADNTPARREMAKGREAARRWYEETF